MAISAGEPQFIQAVRRHTQNARDLKRRARESGDRRRRRGGGGDRHAQGGATGRQQQELALDSRRHLAAPESARIIKLRRHRAAHQRVRETAATSPGSGSEPVESIRSNVFPRRDSAPRFSAAAAPGLTTSAAGVAGHVHRTCRRAVRIHGLPVHSEIVFLRRRVRERTFTDLRRALTVIATASIPISRRRSD